MSKTVTPDMFADEIAAILTKYAEDVQEVVREAATQTGAEAVEELKQSSPKGSRKGAGKYARSWRVRAYPDSWRTRVRVYNTKYQLTHLLEYGHAMRQGGRARAFPHIKPARDKATEKFFERVQKGISELK